MGMNVCPCEVPASSQGRFSWLTSFLPNSSFVVGGRIGPSSSGSGSPPRTRGSITPRPVARSSACTRRSKRYLAQQPPGADAWGTAEPARCLRPLLQHDQAPPGARCSHAAVGPIAPPGIKARPASAGRPETHFRVRYKVDSQGTVTLRHNSREGRLPQRAGRVPSGPSERQREAGAYVWANLVAGKPFIPAVDRAAGCIRRVAELAREDRARLGATGV
jgi:hypothetical protein